MLKRNRRGQSGLWSYAISGDLPIVLLQIVDSANIDLVRRLVQAHAYWRLKGLAVDLVIWNEDRGGYRQVLQDQIMGLIAAGVEAHVMDRPGGIFVRRAEQIAEDDRILLQSVARAIISDRRGTLVEQVGRRVAMESRVPRLQPVRGPREIAPRRATPVRDLILFNGTGGFTPDGREYVITLAEGRSTPLPWSNVLANPGFGTVVSEGGSAYTWSENAHEFRLTPMAQRSGARCQRRSLLPARRGDGALLVAGAAALPGQRRLRHPSRLRLQRVRAPRGRHRRRAVGVRRRRCTGEALRAQGAQCVGPRPAALGHRLRAMGARRPRAQDRDARDHGGRFAHRGAPGAQRVQRRVPRPRRVLRRGRRGPQRHRGPRRIPGTQRHAAAARGDGAYPSLREGRRGPRSLRGAAGALRSRAMARSGRSSSGWARAAMPRTPRRSCSASGGRRPPVPRSLRCTRSGPGRWVPSR